MSAINLSDFKGIDEVLALIEKADQLTRKYTDGSLRIDWGFNSNIYIPEPRREKTELEKRREKFQNKSPKLKNALIERDGEKCRHCGSIKMLCVDHVISISKGGSDELDNLQLLCRSCNSRKHNR
jgi:hypothetical protein